MIKDCVPDSGPPPPRAHKITGLRPPQLSRGGINGGQAAISCTSPTFCVGVGLDEVQVFDGHAWTVSTQAPNPSDLPYQEIGCASRLLCVVASPAGQVEIGTGERARPAVRSR